MKILVLMSTYNGEQYLQEQIESIMQQEDVEVSLLVRDDGSKDNTINLLYTLSSKYRNLVFYSGGNVGFIKSYNELIKKAVNIKPIYDYYAFVDQDDVWHKDKLKIAIKRLSQFPQNSPNLFYSNSILVDSKGNFIGLLKNKPPHFTKGNSLMYPIIQGCSMVFNYKAIEIYSLSINDSAFHDRWMHHICTFLGNTYYEQKPLFDYRVHGNNTIGFKRNKTFQSYFTSLYKTIFVKRQSSYFPWVQDFYNKFEKDLSTENKKIIQTYLKYPNNIKCKFNIMFKSDYYPTEPNITNLLYHLLHTIFNKL